MTIAADESRPVMRAGRGQHAGVAADWLATQGAPQVMRDAADPPLIGNAFSRPFGPRPDQTDLVDRPEPAGPALNNCVAEL